MKETFKVFSIKLARELGLRGFKFFGTEPNRKVPWYNVYLFEDTPELRKAITEINK